MHCAQLMTIAYCNMMCQPGVHAMLWRRVCVVRQRLRCRCARHHNAVRKRKFFAPPQLALAWLAQRMRVRHSRDANGCARLLGVHAIMCVSSMFACVFVCLCVRPPFLLLAGCWCCCCDSHSCTRALRVLTHTSPPK